MDAFVLQKRLERGTELVVTIHEYVPLAKQEAVLEVGQLACDLFRGRIGLLVKAEKLTVQLSSITEAQAASPALSQLLE